MSSISRNHVLLAAAYVIGLIKQGECSSRSNGGPSSSFIPRKGRQNVESGTKATQIASPPPSRDGSELSSIFDVDFYDDTNSRFEDELDDVVDHYDFDSETSLDEEYRSFGDDNIENTFDIDDAQSGGKDALYNAYNELHTVAQGMYSQSLIYPDVCAVTQTTAFNDAQNSVSLSMHQLL